MKKGTYTIKSKIVGTNSQEGEMPFHLSGDFCFDNAYDSGLRYYQSIVRKLEASETHWTPVFIILVNPIPSRNISSGCRLMMTVVNTVRSETEDFPQ